MPPAPPPLLRRAAPFLVCGQRRRVSHLLDHIKDFIRDRKKDIAACRPIVLSLAVVRASSKSLTMSLRSRHAMADPDKSFSTTTLWKSELTASLSQPMLRCSWLATLATDQETQSSNTASARVGVLAGPGRYGARLGPADSGVARFTEEAMRPINSASFSIRFWDTEVQREESIVGICKKQSTRRESLAK